MAGDGVVFPVLFDVDNSLGCDVSTLLLNPVGTDQDGFSNPPLGLLYLAGVLDANGEEVDVVDGCIDGVGAVREAIKRGYDYVGIQALTPNRHRALDLAKEVKRISPRSKTVLGGVHPTIMYEQVKAYPFVDYVIKGEGELGMLSIAQGKGEVHEQMDIDLIPEPAWGKVDLRKYPSRGRTRYDFLPVHGKILRFQPRVSVIFSRGCTAHCSFCSTWWIWKTYRVRSPKLMVDELQNLVERWGISHFAFADDVFSSDKQKTLGLCREIQDRKLKISWHATTRVDAIDEELIEEMKKAGCYGLSLGIETGSAQVLQKIHKSTDIETGEKAIKMCRRVGIHTTALMIVGYIGETYETVKETRDFLRRCRPNSVSAAGGLWIFPGTSVYSKAKKEGLIDDSFWLERKSYITYYGEHNQETLNKFQDIIWSYSWWVSLRRKIRRMKSMPYGGKIVSKWNRILADFKRDKTPLKTFIRKVKCTTIKAKPEWWVVSPYVKGVTINVGCGRDLHKGVIGVDNLMANTYAGWDAKPDVIAEATNLPFEDGTVDTVIAMHLLEHIPERELFFKEAFRVLKDGGTLAFVLPNHDYLGDGCYWADPTHLHLMSPQQDWERKDFELVQKNKLGKFLYSWSFDVIYRKPSKTYLSHSYGVLNAA